MPKSRFLIFSLCLAALSCSQSDAQREFEQEARTFPENITEMTVNGRTVEGGMVDPDDWRIGPDFRSFIEFSSPAVGAYPNPVNLNEPLKIELFIESTNAINGLQLFAFGELNSEMIQVGPIETSTLPVGLKTVVLDPQSFAGQTSGIYRILIYDGRLNLISYGDVEVI